MSDIEMEGLLIKGEMTCPDHRTRAGDECAKSKSSWLVTGLEHAGKESANVIILTWVLCDKQGVWCGRVVKATLQVLC